LLGHQLSDDQLAAALVLRVHLVKLLGEFGLGGVRITTALAIAVM